MISFLFFKYITVRIIVVAPAAVIVVIIQIHIIVLKRPKSLNKTLSLLILLKLFKIHFLKHLLVFLDI